ncbi:22557_t:CDS:2 [Gigaspora margarita]|uniref:22557_t:CDS:1 n=1 Tax=Gigaspora margarita TaxID=4874 RepID=A0ABM8W1F1_GIGMA|nr:22557_t:CDS:2 [Gigaspora margarita]
MILKIKLSEKFFDGTIHRPQIVQPLCHCYNPQVITTLKNNCIYLQDK